MSNQTGKVYLIGAGPGDPGLLTIKAKECIETADVVVYDYLASPYLLEYARKDAEIIYVGKAINLQKRLASYFQRQDAHSPKTALMVARVADIETVITASEKEALILESNLIKRYRPRYNVDLKDDKRYPLLRLDIIHPYPRLSIVRKPKKDGALYFGPYASAHAVRQDGDAMN